MDNLVDPVTREGGVIAIEICWMGGSLVWLLVEEPDDVGVVDRTRDRTNSKMRVKMR